MTPQYWQVESGELSPLIRRESGTTRPAYPATNQPMISLVPVESTTDEDRGRKADK